MSGKKIKMVDGTGQKSMQEAVEDFMRHCISNSGTGTVKIIYSQQATIHS